MPGAATITITSADVLRCNRLRGLSVATCSCRTGADTPDNHAGWQECPPGARGWFDEPFLDACRNLVAPVVTAHPPRGNDRPLAQYTGDICSNCASLEMVRSGSCATCQVCGETGGCS